MSSAPELRRIAVVPAWGWARRLLALLVLPLLLVGPALLPGKRFLPQLPVGFAPLAAEHPREAELAWQSANYCTGDRLFPCLTDQLELRKRLLAGQSPAWEPRLALGLPLFATAITGTLYPPNALALLLPPDLAAAPLALLALFLAGLGMWLFLERRGLLPAACAFGALALQGAAFACGNLHYPMKLDAALWLPWCCWAVEGLAQGKRRSLLALACSAACSALAGFPPIAFFALLAAGLYALARLTPLATRCGLASEPPPRVWGRALAGLALGVLVAAVQLVPTFEASAQSIRQERSAADLYRESLPPATALGLVVPDLFGSPLEPVEAPQLPAAWWFSARSDWERAQTANSLEWSTWIGTSVALLALAACAARPKQAALPLVFALASLGYAQGWFGLRELYRVPGLNLGAPARGLCVAWFAWAWLAALGAQAWAEGEARARLALALGAGALLLGAVWAVPALEPASFAAAQELRLAARHELSLEQVREVVPSELARSAAAALRPRVALTGAAALLALALCALLPALRTLRGSARARFGFAWSALFAPAALAAPIALALAAGHTGPSPWISYAGAVLAGLALCFALRRSAANVLVLPWIALLGCEVLYVQPARLAPRELLEQPVFPGAAGLERIADAAGFEGRVLRIDRSASGAGDVGVLARPNLLHAYGIAELTPYVAFTPRSYVELFAAMDPAGRFRSGISRLSDPALIGHPLLDLLRVGCLLARQPLPPNARLTPLLESDGLCVYRRRGALPLAVLAPRARALEESDLLARVARGELDPQREILLEAGAPEGDRGGDSWVRGALSWSRPGPGELEIELRGSSGGWLLITEQWYPGWRAELDGQPVPTLRAFHALRACEIPPGDHVLRCRYAPASLLAGALLSLLGLLGLAACAWRRW